jgi:type IV secretory pathway VirB10-like protein
MIVPNGAPQLRAFPDQDHMSHISAHIAFIKTTLIQTSPQVYGILLAHIFEHITYMAMQQAQQHAQEAYQSMQRAPGAPPPPPPPAALLQKAAAALENQMIAQVLEQLNPQKTDDPLIQLQQRDLDIREQAVKLKSEEAALRIDLDERKLQQKQSEDAQKRASLEDIQQLRANVSIARARESKRV